VASRVVLGSIVKAYLRVSGNAIVCIDSLIGALPRGYTWWVSHMVATKKLKVLFFFYFSITESGTGCILALMEVECRKVGWGENG
jgi:hypothetical protein